MKLNSKFYTTFNDAKENNPTYISVIPIYESSPVNIYPMNYCGQAMIVCESKSQDNFFITPQKIKILNGELNFSTCKDVRICMYDAFGISNCIIECNMSNIKYIDFSKNEDDELQLIVKFTNNEQIHCKSIKNLG